MLEKIQVLRVEGIDVAAELGPWGPDLTELSETAGVSLGHDVGTLAVDLSLDAEALGDGGVRNLLGVLQGHGYTQREGLRRFQLVRQVPARDGGYAIDGVVDFFDAT